MNVDVFILFFNATLVTIVSCVVVLRILKKQYLPIIKEEERKQQSNEPDNEVNSKKGGINQ